MKAPDVKAHFYMSIVKSIFRIGACIASLATGSINILLVVFIFAELIGILEEIK